MSPIRRAKRRAKGSPASRLALYCEVAWANLCRASDANTNAHHILGKRFHIVYWKKEVRS